MSNYRNSVSIYVLHMSCSPSEVCVVVASPILIYMIYGILAIWGRTVES